MSHYPERQKVRFTDRVTPRKGVLATDSPFKIESYRSRSILDAAISWDLGDGRSRLIPIDAIAEIETERD